GVLVGDRDRVTLHHDIEPLVPGVASGAEDHVPVAAQVDGLLLLCAGTEVQRIAVPYGHERGHVRPAVGADRGDPEQLSLFERPPGLLPSGSGRVRSAEPRVQGGYRGSHRVTSFWSSVGGGPPAIRRSLLAQTDRGRAIHRRAGGRRAVP